MSKEYDNFWKFHNKNDMDVHAVRLIEQLQAENKRLKEALRIYGQHTKECHDERYPEAWHCTCGLEQALKGGD